MIPALLGCTQDLAALERSTIVYFDCETTGLAPTKGGLRLLQFFARGVEAPIVLDCWEFGPSDWDRLRAFCGQPRSWVAHNAVFDVSWLQEHGVHFFPGRVYCTMLASVLVWNGKPNIKHSLSELYHRITDEDIDKELQRSDWSGRITAEQLIYAANDVRALRRLYGPLTEMLKHANLMRAWQHECSALQAVAQMQRFGMRWDVPRLSELAHTLTTEAHTLQADFLAAAGAYTTPGVELNLKSPKQMLRVFTEALGYEPKGPDGRPSTSKAALEPLRGENPVVDAFLNYRRRLKGAQMAQALLNHCDTLGRTRCSYRQMGAETGRFSCVAGETLLHTSRGVFRFDTYLPAQGDLVLTHRGQWRSVVRKIYKGTAPMVEVRDSLGAKLTCTGDHRLLTPTGWAWVADLRVGDTVVHQSNPDRGSGLRREGGGALQGRAETDRRAGGEGATNHRTHGAAHTQAVLVKAGAQGRAGVALLTIEGRCQEPYAGQEWLPAPQLQGFGVRSEGTFNRTGWQGRACDAASTDHGRAVRPSEAAGRVACPPHRRGRDEQQPGQPGSGYTRRAQSPARQEAQIVSIVPVGSLGVWDIEVAEDHSYAAGGYLNHNSVEPNTQQIPRDPRFRECVVAAPGYQLVVADYSQMELRLAAVEAQDRVMVQAFCDGQDLHTLTARAIYQVDEPDKVQRQVAKSANFGLLYGAGARGLKNYAATMGIDMSLEEANTVRSTFLELYSGVAAWHKEAAFAQELSAKGCGQWPFVRIRRTRMRRFLKGDANLMTRRLNTVIQGAGAAILKETLSTLWLTLHRTQEDEAVLLATVHDEIIMSVRDDAVERWVGILQETMETVEAEWLELPDGRAVPPAADAHSGSTWLAAK